MPEKLKVLLVDDDPSWLEALSDILKRCGLRVEKVSSAVEAVKVFSKEKFQLIITDFAMPQMNGVELAKILRTKSNGIPIILMSGDKTIRTSKCVVQAGVDICIDKSDNLEEVLKRIERLIHRSLSLQEKTRQGSENVQS